MESPIYKFLHSFLTLLGGSRIDNYIEKDGCARGSLRYPDEEDEEDFQDFYWECEWSNKDLKKMTELCDFLKRNNFVYEDIIKLSESYLAELLSKEGWDKIEAHKALDNLLDVDVRMVDDGELTDSFFLHL